MNFMYITNNPDITCYANSCGIKRIFVDLEILGKYERQGHLDTVISNHSEEDINKVKAASGSSEVLVRINPFNNNTNKEVERAITEGADIIMLPMFHSKEEVNTVGKMINGRAKFIPLIETKTAAESLETYVDSPYVSEFYIGLNDLHRELGFRFMFEIISTGYLDQLVAVIKTSGKRFGFGGVARIGEGTLPASLILGEHVRLGSSAVILSRAFHQRSKNLMELKSKLDLELEVSRLYSDIERLKNRTYEQVQHDKNELKRIVDGIVEGEM
ncbi:aldolase/citrate lyase family protein [Vibrio splendidus]|uniref:aldolase/citrate lyase family protein n=1 Tax=Vibrio splendidus TaxID=29497 RepID=UPI003D119021